MNPSSDPQPRFVRYSARRQARLDAAMYAKLEELAAAFHRTRAAILRYVLQWGLIHGKDWAVDRSVPASVHLVPLLVEPALLQPVQAASAAHGADVAQWERQAMRQMTLEDFPASWRAGEMAPRSHGSAYYRRPFMLRLDHETSSKLATLTQTFHRSADEVIRQLIAQARPEDFPPRWQLAVQEGAPQRVPREDQP